MEKTLVITQQHGPKTAVIGKVTIDTDEFPGVVDELVDTLNEIGLTLAAVQEPAQAG